jgi:hypothetical protein
MIYKFLFHVQDRTFIYFLQQYCIISVILSVDKRMFIMRNKYCNCLSYDNIVFSLSSVSAVHLCCDLPISSSSLFTHIFLLNSCVIYLCFDYYLCNLYESTHSQIALQICIPHASYVLLLYSSLYLFVLFRS